jgi:hypothetical protein
MDDLCDQMDDIQDQMDCGPVGDMLPPPPAPMPAATDHVGLVMSQSAGGSWTLTPAVAALAGKGLAQVQSAGSTAGADPEVSEGGV